MVEPTQADIIRLVVPDSVLIEGTGLMKQVLILQQDRLLPEIYFWVLCVFSGT